MWSLSSNAASAASEKIEGIVCVGGGVGVIFDLFYYYLT